MAETEDIKQIKSSLLQLSGRLNVVNKNISKLENLNQNLKVQIDNLKQEDKKLHSEIEKEVQKVNNIKDKEELQKFLQGIKEARELEDARISSMKATSELMSSEEFNKLVDDFYPVTSKEKDGKKHRHRSRSKSVKRRKTKRSKSTRRNKSKNHF